MGCNCGKKLTQTAGTGGQRVQAQPVVRVNVVAQPIKKAPVDGEKPYVRGQ